MNSASSAQLLSNESAAAIPTQFRREAAREEPIIFTDIYNDDTNIAIWQRELSNKLKLSKLLLK